ncbi:MAG: ergothioneine biosynthesis protein EgtB [Bacillota bacterium]
MGELIKEVQKKKKDQNDLFSLQSSLAHRYKSVREYTETICTPLKTEDYVIQSMPDVSPVKWHLAHTSWFFETFVLKKLLKGYTEYNPLFSYLFNSYYVQAGPRFQRSERGLLSRPTVEEVYMYRNYVDRNMLRLFEILSDKEFENAAPVIELGLNHEQQHQELILTDIKHVFSLNPLNPVYCSRERAKGKASELNWVSFDENMYIIGHSGSSFAFDNEKPSHWQFIESFELASRLITNGEYMEFIDSGGYQKAELWLSDGWAMRQKEGWNSPLYWFKDNESKDSWQIFTLRGVEQINTEEPVCHISYYEADAFARWKGCRLAAEYEWEAASAMAPLNGNFLENSSYHPDIDQPEIDPVSDKIGSADNSQAQLRQLFGDLWEWTCSSYSPYPHYKTLPGALGEYNGKFMSGQMVLRGGSCVTPQSHIRKTYRNFFPPGARWQFSGIRLARDII